MKLPREILNTQSGNRAFIFDVPGREGSFEWENIVYLEPLDTHTVIAWSNDDGDVVAYLSKIDEEPIAVSRDNACLDDALLSLQEMLDGSIVTWYAPQTLGE